MASEDKMMRLESDLALIADQEKLIVTQLAHIDNSKQKLRTIIENTNDQLEDSDEKKSQQDVIAIADRNNSTSATDKLNDNDTDEVWVLSQQKTSSPLETRESSPNQVDRNNDMNNLKYGNISPIKTLSPKFISSSSLTLNMSPTEIGLELKRLVEHINDQKTVVLECLENDCDKEELNGHMSVSRTELFFIL